MGRPKALTKKQVLKAIENSNGIVSTIAKRLQCNWHTAKNYIEKWEETKQAVAEEEEVMLDTAESQAFKLVEMGDGVMIRFYLATKGKKRGYIQDDKGDELDASQNNGVRIEIVDKRAESEKV